MVMKVKKQFLRLRIRAKQYFERLCNKSTNNSKLLSISVACFFFGAVFIYVLLSAIYYMGNRDGDKIRIQHSRYFK